jgi:hypothetical protein
MSRKWLAVAPLSFTLVSPGVRPAGAQEPPRATAPAEAAAEAESTPKARKAQTGPRLSVTVVLSRFKGETKALSLPYTFLVTSDGPRARLRMGVSTPVPTVAPGPERPAAFQYKNVGTNIDCGAREVEAGRYLLHLSLEHTSTLVGPGASEEMPGMPEVRVPLFRTFDASLEPILRDGETQEILASTDPATGEVLKIEVTLNRVR